MYKIDAEDSFNLYFCFQFKNMIKKYTVLMKKDNDF